MIILGKVTFATVYLENKPAKFEMMDPDYFLG